LNTVDFIPADEANEGIYFIDLGQQPGHALLVYLSFNIDVTVILRDENVIMVLLPSGRCPIGNVWYLDPPPLCTCDTGEKFRTIRLLNTNSRYFSLTNKKRDNNINRTFILVYMEYVGRCAMDLGMKEKSDKRTAILDASLKLISKHGFHSTSMAMVVKESGVSTGVIYHYFVSKEEIIMELYKTIKFDAIQTMLENFSEDQSIYKRFKSIWLGSLNYCRLHPTEVSFLDQFEYSPYLTPSLSEEFYAELKPIADLIDKSMEEGVVKNLPVDVLVKLFNEGAVLLGKKYSGKTDFPDKELVELTLKACWDAIKK